MNHSHILYDSDPHFKIDSISRKITNESSTKTTLIQHDHNSERFTFEVPRYVEGHDLSLCNVVEIHYLNVEANTKNVRAGVYTVDDLQVKADDENTVVCSWLVSHNATQLVGQLQFLVRFSCVSEDTGKIEYVWNTAPYTNISVSSGIYNSESPSDTPVPAYNFVTTINGDVLKFFVGTQAEYDALNNEAKDGLFAIISDDKTKEEIFEAIEDLRNAIEDLQTDLQTDFTEFKNGIVNGTIPAKKATIADAVAGTPVSGDLKNSGTGIYLIRLYVWGNSRTAYTTVILYYDETKSNNQSSTMAFADKENENIVYAYVVASGSNGALNARCIDPNGLWSASVSSILKLS